MPPVKDPSEMLVRLHCDIHDLALSLGKSAFKLIGDGRLATVTCPGRHEGEDHDISVDPDFVPFRLDLVDPSRVGVGSGLHPDR